MTRPDYTRIALLEHALFGVEPKPGTKAAELLGAQRFAEELRAACDHDDVIETPTLGELRKSGICQCGESLVETGDGGWEKA